MKRKPNFQWDMAKLMESETWLDEARRGLDEGIISSSQFGVSCPKCWKPIGCHIELLPKTEQDKACQCGEENADFAEIATHLGIPSGKNTAVSLPI